VASVTMATTTLILHSENQNMHAISCRGWSALIFSSFITPEAYVRLRPSNNLIKKLNWSSLSTYSLTHSWSWVLLEKLPIAQPLKK
jgi:hypothetical protein